jgi:cbb3-type cytochrome oxidase maturation protein
MDILFVLLPLSTVLAGVFVWLFVRAVRDGQFDDLDDAAQRILDDDE